MPTSVSRTPTLNSADAIRSEMPVSALDMPVTALAGVGSKVAEQLAQLMALAPNNYIYQS